MGLLNFARKTSGAEVWLCPDLVEMLLGYHSEVIGFDQKDSDSQTSSIGNERGCYASNRYFSEFFGISERQIQTYIASLKLNGFIIVTIQNRYDRVMRATGKYARVHGEELRQLHRDKARLAH